MKKIILAAAVLLLRPALYSQQAATAPNWDAWTFLEGKWIGKVVGSRARAAAISPLNWIYREKCSSAEIIRSTRQQRIAPPMFMKTQ
jgi:hypothetical protein